MARMLGRTQIPGCCPGTRDGRYPGPDCSGGGTMLPRYAKRIEERQVAREIDAELAPDPSVYLRGPLFDFSDCRHGCNGDCVVMGMRSDMCNFTCHPGLEPDPEKAARYDAALERWQQAARDGH